MRIIYTTNMKTVVVALIKKDNQYLIAKRKDDTALGGYWEFPGGKVEAGESDEAALEREILDEFNSLISVGKLLASAQINDHIVLKLYACEHKLGAYQLKDHSEIAWVNSLSALDAYDLAPADIELLDHITNDTRKPSLHHADIPSERAGWYAKVESC